jgi:hypothetical protein
MFKVIFLSQAILYLMVAPFIKQEMVFGYDALFFFGLTACGALAIGFKIFKNSRDNSPTAIVPNRLMMPATFVLAALYCYTSFIFELIDRRQGSEYMALVFSSLPIWALLVVRVYEIVFLPVLIILLKSGNSVSPVEKYTLIGVIIFSVPFMGLADSRGRVLVMALSIIIFYSYKSVASFVRESVSFYAMSATAVGVFAFVSLTRAQAYARVSDFYLTEVVNRIDGMNMIRSIVDYGEFRFWGSYDWDMFRVAIAKIPFLAEAQYLKSVGKTSTKQYMLQDVLGFSKLDDSNSMISDPLYFGGLPMLVVAFIVLGYFLAKFDNAVETGRALANPVIAAGYFAFGLSFIMIEADLVGATLSMVQTFPALLIIFLFGCKRVNVSDPQR